MPENIAQTIQKAIQDLVAPDVRELKVLVSALQKQIDQRFEQVEQRFEQVGKRFEQVEKRFDAQDKHFDQRFEQVDQRFEQVDKRFDAQGKHFDQRFDALSKRTDSQFRALMAAFGEFKAQSELASVRVIASLSERVAVLEARHQ